LEAQLPVGSRRFAGVFSFSGGLWSSSKASFKGESHMRAMEEKILREGRVLPGGILKVGNFLNQQIDTGFLKEIGEEIARLFADCGVTKILTIESSGIAIAAAAGVSLGVPVLFAKKHQSSNVDGEVLAAKVHSFTHGNDYNAVVSKEYLKEGDCVLLVDDFLASGEASVALSQIVETAGAEVAGIGAVIEKGFQGGSDRLRAMGYRVESLAVIEKIDDGVITFK
jgi:xanthine phosphoribosyltransferase